MPNHLLVVIIQILSEPLFGLTVDVNFEGFSKSIPRGKLTPKSTVESFLSVVVKDSFSSQLQTALSFYDS